MRLPHFLLTRYFIKPTNSIAPSHLRSRKMFLSIPILDLLNSQLEIGFDPLSGNITYNIKLEDTPSFLQHGNVPENVMLILQTSPGCLRICTKSTTDSVHQSAYDTCQGVFISGTLGISLKWSVFFLATTLTAFAPPGQSDWYHAHFAERIAPSIPDVHGHGQGITYD